MPPLRQFVLPSPAREVFPQVYDALIEQFADRDGQPQFSLGGATILAARWHHRRSRDLDFKVWDAAALYQYTTGRAAQDLDETVYRCSRGLRNSTWPNQITYRIPGRHDIDLTGGEGVLARPREQVAIEGRAIEIVDTEEILWGKVLGRSEHAPVRDLFDFDVALRMDRESLETAVNALHTRHVATVLHQWHELRKTYEKEARTLLEGVPPRFEALQDKCWAHASAAFALAAYREVHTVYENGRARVQARLHDQNEKEIGDHTDPRAVARQHWELGIVEQWASPRTLERYAAKMNGPRHVERTKTLDVDLADDPDLEAAVRALPDRAQIEVHATGRCRIDRHWFDGRMDRPRRETVAEAPTPGEAARMASELGIVPETEVLLFEQTLERERERVRRRERQRAQH